MQDWWYRLVFLIVSLLNVLIDNYLIIILIVVVYFGFYMFWKIKRI